MKTTLPALKKLFNEPTPKNNKYAYLLAYMDEHNLFVEFKDSFDPLKFRVEKLSTKLKINIVYTSFFTAYKKYEQTQNDNFAIFIHKQKNQI